eukprot:gene2620-biopygen1112
MYRSAAPMRLYLIRDVARVALKKHASSSHTRIPVPAISADERRTSRETLLSKKLGDMTLDSRIFSVSESACRARDLYVNSGRGGGAVKVAADIIATNTRLHILERALEDRGCELRSDSRLCTGFVDNDDGDPEDIAVSMLEMKFFHNHTEYASILDDLCSSAKSEAMKQWADTHDLDDVLDIPESLRSSVFHLKAECIVSDTRKAWRAPQPRIPVQVLNNIETVFYQIHKRTRNAESLASLRSTLEDAESGLSARVDAVSVMWDKIREWPHAIPGGPEFRSWASYGDSWVLCAAAREGHADVCKLLMAAPGFPARANAANSRALWVAAAAGHTDVCRLLMDPVVAGGHEFRARANAVDSRAFCEAAKAGHADVCRLLMDPVVAGDEFRARANAVNSMALCEVAKTGYVEVCKVLMDLVMVEAGRP